MLVLYGTVFKWTGFACNECALKPIKFIEFTEKTTIQSLTCAHVEDRKSAASLAVLAYLPRIDFDWRWSIQSVRRFCSNFVQFH